MKKFAVSLIALAAISGSAFAVETHRADSNVPAFAHNRTGVATKVDSSALAVDGMAARSEIPHYINRSQLR